MPTKRNLSRAVRRAAIYGTPSPAATPDPQSHYFEGRDELERILMGLDDPVAAKAARHRPTSTPTSATWTPPSRTLVARFQLQRCLNCGHECYPFVGLFHRNETRLADGTAVTYTLAPKGTAGTPAVETLPDTVEAPLCPLCKGDN